jgi:hypothetical protein
VIRGWIGGWAVVVAVWVEEWAWIDVFVWVVLFWFWLLGGDFSVWVAGGAVGLLASDAFEDVAEEAFGSGVAGGDFGDGGEWALDGIEVEFVDLVEVFVVGFGRGFGASLEVGGGDLDGVEEDSGAAAVELVHGDAAGYLCDGKLDGGAVLEAGKVEGGVGRDELGAGRGAAGGVMEVAEVLVAQRGRAAAVAGGVDVAADVADGCDLCGLCGLHVWAPPRVF